MEASTTVVAVQYSATDFAAVAMTQCCLSKGDASSTIFIAYTTAFACASTRVMPTESADALPPQLRAFLHSCIESIDQVELLMMLRGSNRFRTAREVAAESGASPATARRNLETLAARGLLDVRVGEETAYLYRPKSEELGRYCDLLAQHYITSRPAVLGFVATEARLSIKRFADAFKLRDQE